MTGKSIEILVVDDEQGYRDLFTFMLTPMGIGVTCACDGLEAIERIQEKIYDVVMMDVHMPKLNGLETLKKMRLLRPAQKVIIFSSSSDSEYHLESQAEKEGAVECLFKPVDIEEIQRALKKALGADYEF